MSELQRHILGMSISERLQLVSFIISSISEKNVSPTIPIPDKWIQQALMRNQEYESGKSKAYSWEEVKAKINGGKE